MVMFGSLYTGWFTIQLTPATYSCTHLRWGASLLGSAGQVAGGEEDGGLPVHALGYRSVRLHPVVEHSEVWVVSAERLNEVLGGLYRQEDDENVAAGTAASSAHSARRGRVDSIGAVGSRRERR